LEKLFDRLTKLPKCALDFAFPFVFKTSSASYYIVNLHQELLRSFQNF